MMIPLSAQALAQGALAELFMPPAFAPQGKIEASQAFRNSSYSYDDPPPDARDNDYDSLDSKIDARLYAIKNPLFGVALAGSAESVSPSISNPLLPDHLSDINIGLSGYYELEPFANYGITASVSYIEKSDTHRGESGQGIQALGLMRIPVNKEWTLLPGIFYSSLRFGKVSVDVPFPTFSAFWRPSEKLSVIMGVPFAGVIWDPIDWMKLTAFSFFGVRGSVSLAETVKFDDGPDIIFSQFFRTLDRSWQVRDERSGIGRDAALYQLGYQVGTGIEVKQQNESYDWSAKLEVYTTFGEKWEYRDRDDELIGDPIRNHEGFAARITFSISFGKPSFNRAPDSGAGPPGKGRAE